MTFVNVINKLVVQFENDVNVNFFRIVINFEIEIVKNFWQQRRRFIVLFEIDFQKWIVNWIEIVWKRRFIVLFEIDFQWRFVKNFKRQFIVLFEVIFWKRRFVVFFKIVKQKRVFVLFEIVWKKRFVVLFENDFRQFFNWIEIDFRFRLNFFFQFRSFC